MNRPYSLADAIPDLADEKDTSLPTQEPFNFVSTVPEFAATTGIFPLVARASRLAYSIAGLAAETGLSRTTIYEEVKKGRLRITKVGRRSIVTDDDAHAWLHSLAENEHESPDEI